MGEVWCLVIVFLIVIVMLLKGGMQTPASSYIGCELASNYPPYISLNDASALKPLHLISE